MPSLDGGALYLILIQVTSRGLTFVGNQILLRYLSPTLLGIAVQFELVSVTVLYFARESLRVALQRQPVIGAYPASKISEQPGVAHRSQALVNLSYISVTLGLVIAVLSGSSYVKSASFEVTQSPYFTQVFCLYALATLIELFAEPGFVVIQQYGLYKARARAETSSAIARCIVACSTAFILSRRHLRPSVLPFAAGQLAYATTLFVLYLRAARRASRQDNFNLSLRTVSEDETTKQKYLLSLFSKPILSLAITMYLQSVFKLLLTQGDALILSILASLADQGAFALAGNYGGLLARLIFQPVEESSRNIFGRLLSTTSATVIRQPTTSTTKPENVSTALAHLSTILHFYLLLALPFFSIAPYILPILVRQLIGKSWYTSSTAALLSTYCYYIPFMAVNGILDAFVTSVATPSQIRAQSLWMALFTGVYGLSAWILLQQLHWGAEGLVMANIANMAVRIVWSSWFISGWVTERQPLAESKDKQKTAQNIWKRSSPDLACVVVALGVVVGLKLGLKTQPDAAGQSVDLEDLSLIVAGTLVLGIAILLCEFEFLLSMLETVVPQRYLQKVKGMIGVPVAERLEPGQEDNAITGNKKDI